MVSVGGRSYKCDHRENPTEMADSDYSQEDPLYRLMKQRIQTLEREIRRNNPELAGVGDRVGPYAIWSDCSCITELGIMVSKGKFNR